MKSNQLKTVRVMTLARLARLTPSQLLHATRSQREPEPDQPLRAYYFVRHNGKVVVFGESAPTVSAKTGRKR